ncbi:kelch-like protein 25 isoform X2 [Babylonia areolata]|uniref:kelch-like protein 25 isoform X2 n=1 Tax=Babylonia areolata TaxID=304850 RepID=UPI003FD09AE5
MKLTELDRFRSENFVYQDTSLLLSLQKQFNVCRQTNRFIDLEVEVKDRVFPCHQLIMDALCPYFSAHFKFSECVTEGEAGEKGMKMRSVQRVSLKYDGLTVLGFSKLLDFMYTAELEVVQMCSAFMLQHISEDTCLPVLALAQAHGLSELEDKARNFVLTSFARVIHREEFGQLSKDMLVSIASDSCLELEREEVVTEAVQTWVRNHASRCHLQQQLAQNAHLHPADLDRLKGEDMSVAVEAILDEIYSLMRKRKATRKREVKVGGDCPEVGKDLIIDPVHHFGNKSLDKVTGLHDPPSRLTHMLVVVSRKTEYQSTSWRPLDWRRVYSYNSTTGLWEYRTSLPFSGREGYNVAVLNNMMHVTGGQSLSGSSSQLSSYHRGMTVFSDHLVYNPLDGKWEQKKPMNVPRFNHSSAAMLNRVYVVGGRKTFDEATLLANGEEYNPGTDQWTFIAPVRSISGIGNAAMASLNGKLYIVGGVYCQRGDHYENYFGAQVYDPEEDLWQEVLPLEQEIFKENLRFSSGSLLAIEGLLIMVNEGFRFSHYIYNPISQTFRPLMSAHGHHLFAGWEVYEGRLVATGGLADGRVGMSDMVHGWDLSSDNRCWQMMPSLPMPLSHHACVSLYFDGCGDAPAPNWNLSEGEL